MGSLMIVAAPVLGHAPDFVQADEYVAIQDLSREGPVEALDVSVLGRLARLDVQRHVVPRGPLPQRGTDELQAVVQPLPKSRRVAI